VGLLITAPFGLARRAAVVGETLRRAGADAAQGRRGAPAATPRPQATPRCGDDDGGPRGPGPVLPPNSPLRRSLIEPGTAGTRIVVSGAGFTRACKPVPGALLDFWHADDAGEYDNEGFKLRGHQFTDASGRYRLETIVPGLYPGRTRHFHVRVQAPHGRVLTTQLFPANHPAAGTSSTVPIC
jgi:protocatechuate 3,4-dioxygenase beta subunit